jgi:hypothetical protein
MERYSSIFQQQVDLMKQNTDVSRQNVEYKPGDKVLFNESKFHSKSKIRFQPYGKFLPKWLGPFTVLKHLSPNVIQLVEPIPNVNTRNLNISYFKPFYEPTIDLIYRYKSDVMLNPPVFEYACRILQFRPNIDMFATARHHQLPRYCSPTKDPAAFRVNCYSLNWNLYRPYLNPPWEDISKTLEKFVQERTIGMLVIPLWQNATWFQLWKTLDVRHIILDEPIYLDDSNRLRPPPNWKTVISIVDSR